jgi:hypothetical protein
MAPLVTESALDSTSTTDTTPTDTLPTFQEAFAAAKATHAEPAATETDTETDTETTETPSETPAETPATETDDKSSLLSDKEYDALAKKHANDPIKLRKELNKAFTQKTQRLAEQAKRFERFEQFEDVLTEFEADPARTITKLATQYGLKLADTATPETAAATTAAAETAQPAIDALVAGFKEKLGPEFEYLADSLAPAVMHLVESLTKQTVEQTVAPLKADHDARVAQQATEQTTSIMKSFETKHPDWKQHEPAMLKLAEKIQPNGMDEIEYLELLHSTVTRDRVIADATKAAIAKMKEEAAKAEPSIEPTAGSRVKKGRPQGASFSDAYAAAKRGERWDDD